MDFQVGEVIGDFVYQKFYVANDIVIAWNGEGECRCFITSSLDGNPKQYTIDDQEIKYALVPENHELIILKTSDKVYYRDAQNQEIEGANLWIDYFYEELNNNFYRKDKHDNWYNLEGNKMDKPVFLQDNVLVSLKGKVSIRSLVFRKEELVCSPNYELIQIGKLVYDKSLRLVNYLGERITEIGKCNVQFGKGDNLQEVRIGVDKVGFINEQSKEVCQIDGDEIIEFAGKVDFFDKHSFKIFKSVDKLFFLEKTSTSVFCIDDKPVALRPDSYFKFGSAELVGVEDVNSDYFVDINTKQTYRIPELENDLIQHISNEPLHIGSEAIYNIKTNKREVAFCLTQNKVFTIENGTIVPDSVEIVEGFQTYFFIAVIKGVKKLCYTKDASIIILGEHQLEVSEVLGKNTHLLLNAVGVNGEHFVLDGRNGYDKLTLAMCQGKRIMNVIGETEKFSNLVLQKVEWLNIGGKENGVINLNVKDLELFRLPPDMQAYPDQEEKSIFSGNIVQDVDFETPIHIGDNSFFEATFLNYLGKSHPVIISSNTGRPLQLLSLGHRLELVTKFDSLTLQSVYRLGTNRMIGAFTLSEDMKERELLFSAELMSSWIPFYDTHLPVFRRIVEINGLEDWEYILFESREGTNEKEYVAVEKAPPYRILAEKKSGKQQIKIIEGDNIALKTPERVSAIKKFFNLDPGYLVELD